MEISTPNVGVEKKKKDASKRACTSCRGHHLKCDGNQPCHQCKKKNIECSYVQPKKRGPKTKELRQLKVQLSKECEELQRKLAQLADEEKQKLENEEEREVKRRKISVFSLDKVPRSHSLVLDSLFRNYLDRYFEFFHPALEIVDKRLYSGLERSQVVSLLESQDNFTNKLVGLQINVMFALSARLCGDFKEAADLFEVARKFLANVYDENDYLIAQSLLLMSYYSHCEGNGLKATSYSSFAMQICKNLNNTNNVVYRTAMLGLGFSEKDPKERDLILQRVDTEYSSITEKVLHTFARVWCNLLFTNHFHDYPSMLNIVKDTEIRLFNSYPQSERYKASFILNQIAIYALKAMIFYDTCLYDYAQFWADEIIRLTLISDPRSLSLSSVYSIGIVTKIHILLNRRDLLHSDLFCLEKLSSVFPISRGFLQIISTELNIKYPDPITTQTIDLFSDDLISDPFKNDKSAKHSENNEFFQQKVASVAQLHQMIGIPPEKINHDEIAILLKMQSARLRKLEKAAPNFITFTTHGNVNISTILARISNGTPNFSDREAGDSISHILRSINELSERKSIFPPPSNSSVSIADDFINLSNVNNVILNNINILNNTTTTNTLSDPILNNNLNLLNSNTNNTNNTNINTTPNNSFPNVDFNLKNLINSNYHILNNINPNNSSNLNAINTNNNPIHSPLNPLTNHLPNLNNNNNISNLMNNTLPNNLSNSNICNNLPNNLPNLNNNNIPNNLMNNSIPNNLSNNLNNNLMNNTLPNTLPNNPNNNSNNNVFGFTTNEPINVDNHSFRSQLLFDSPILSSSSNPIVNNSMLPPQITENINMIDNSISFPPTDCFSLANSNNNSNNNNNTITSPDATQKKDQPFPSSLSSSSFANFLLPNLSQSTPQLNNPNPVDNNNNNISNTNSNNTNNCDNTSRDSVESFYDFLNTSNSAPLPMNPTLNTSNNSINNSNFKNLEDQNFVNSDHTFFY